MYDDQGVKAVEASSRLSMHTMSLVPETYSDADKFLYSMKFGFESSKLDLTFPI